MSRRTAEIVKNGALLGASLLVTVLASELALRATGYRPALADPAMYVANDDEHLPYRMRPYYEGYYMGQKVRLDGDGYRIVAPDATRRTGSEREAVEDAHGQAEGRDAGASSAPRTRQLLLLGDSVVFGHGLADDEAPAAQLQQLFASRGRAVRVRNAAVSGFTSWNELAALEEYLARHEVDAVVLVYLENDITFDHNQLQVSEGTFGNIDSSAAHRVTQALYRHVYLSYLIRNGIERAKRLLAAEGSDESAVTDAAATIGTPRLDHPAFPHSLEALRRMRALCEREGTAFAVGIYRDVTYYTDPDRVHRYETRLGKTLAEHDIDSFVMGSHVERLDRTSARLAWNDPHPTAEAVGIFVEDIMRAAGPLLDP